MHHVEPAHLCTRALAEPACNPQTPHPRRRDMELYETAAIELEQFDEDVITASVRECHHVVCESDAFDIWIIYYEDDQEEVPGPDKPEVCP